MLGQEAGLTPFHVAKEGEALTVYPGLGERKTSSSWRNEALETFLKQRTGLCRQVQSILFCIFSNTLSVVVAQ